MKIKVFEAFAGYGSQMMALRRLSKHSPNLQFELVGWSEIDYYAIQAHNAVWEDDRDRITVTSARLIGAKCLTLTYSLTHFLAKASATPAYRKV